MTVDVASEAVGFFQFGPENICYGRNRGGVSATIAGSDQFDASKAIRSIGQTMNLPFNFVEVIDNLRSERYRQEVVPRTEVFGENESIRKLYYFIREWLPVNVRRQLQKIYFRDWKEIQFPAWPVDFTVDNLHEEFLRLTMENLGVDRMPFIWFWPNGASNCLMMTHDVETSAGRDFTAQLMDLDDSYGMSASYQVIPEKRYEVSDEYVAGIRARGFEFNLHDLNHDGKLYRERREFERRAARINDYFRQFNSRGFRAGAMYRNQGWYGLFDYSYDMSVPNVAHLEPMRGGCCTVMPYFVGKIVELPLTTAQDYSIVHILNDYSIELWKEQITLLRKRNGLMSFLTHPDYLIEPRAREVYKCLLEYLRQMVVREHIWSALPGDVDLWWRARSKMQIVSRGEEWEIVGPENEKARLTFAVLDGGRIVYEFPNQHSHENVQSNSRLAL
jgi:hypothetical protein